MATEQQSFDFNRAAQLRILEQALLAGRGPLKAILKALDSFARESHEAFPSVRQIAHNVGCSRDTARRALHELQELGLVGITRRLRPNGSHSSNSYVINWLRILELAPSSSLFLESGGTGTVQGGTGTVQGGTGTVRGGYSHGASPTHNRPLKRPKNRHHEKSQENETEDGRRETGKRTCWGRSLRRRELLHPPSILFLYKLAGARGWLGKPGASCEAFFALAHFCAREGRDPGGYFTDRVRLGRFDQPETFDRTWAREAIATLGNRIDRPETTEEKALRYVELFRELQGESR